MNAGTIRSLLLNQHTYLNLLDERVVIETDGAYGVLCRAADKGEPSMGLLDVIDAERALERVREVDEAAWAASILSMAGARPEQLGGLFSQRLAKGRSGRQMLSDAATIASVRSREAAS